MDHFGIRTGGRNNSFREIDCLPALFREGLDGPLACFSDTAGSSAEVP